MEKNLKVLGELVEVKKSFFLTEPSVCVCGVVGRKSLEDAWLFVRQRYPKEEFTGRWYFKGKGTWDFEVKHGSSKNCD